ncbi:18S rRNA biogenesis protein [Gonapodya prolifera JEL478]|uniref:18S rRNA biogenesis protein n=1 Tax=Gonapodya prolifera (strain JEL478) TaxID=1344416 RepID=A0A139ACF2_GONPJ|nr:18S rRNA biogenesis protein [Gonapodya prolifera JEL478]|eukprot:KXS14428.1 18S rRNA biogenesis protein [Gonapodya prolifera JEL478]
MVIRFEGHAHFRQRLVLATLAQKAITVNGIRPSDDNPGLRDYEISFLRLLEKVSNGCVIEISYTGTSVHYRPGVITGGDVHHACPTSRAIGYFLEPLVALAPFSKLPFELTLTGITNDNVDPTVDMIRTVLLPVLRRFSGGLENGMELQIKHRGAPPLGGGLIRFLCPTTRQLSPLNFTDRGLIKRVRGVAYASRVSPQMANRVADAARGALTEFLPDVYVYSDVYKGEEAGKSPGYALTLVAESTTGALYHAEVAFQTSSSSSSSSSSTDTSSTPAPTSASASSSLRRLESNASSHSHSHSSSHLHLHNSYHFATPEDLSTRCVQLLLREIDLGGCVDTGCQWLACLMMVLGPEDVGRVRVGRRLGEFTIQYLRDIKTFFGSEFKVREDPDTGEVLLSCVGTGYVNFGKKTT